MLGRIRDQAISSDLPACYRSREEGNREKVRREEYNRQVLLGQTDISSPVGG